MTWFKKPKDYSGWLAMWFFFALGYTGEQWFSQHQSWLMILPPLSYLFCGAANLWVNRVVEQRNCDLVKRRDELRAELNTHLEALNKALDEHDQQGTSRPGYRN